MTTNKPPVTNVTLADQLSYKDNFAKGVSYNENNSFLVMGETEEGEEVSLVAGLMRNGGGRDGCWMVDDAFLGQTTFLVVPKSGGMHDNDFIGNRTWATDGWTGDVVKTKDSVIWKTGNRQHICRPPYWELKGENYGVELDLLLTAMGDASIHKGPYAELATRGEAGYEQPMFCEGTIKAEGKTYTLIKEKSFGCQEKFTCPAWDLAKVLTGTHYYWIWWANESVRIFLYWYPSAGRTFSHVVVDGKDIEFSENGRNDFTLDETEWWIDPRTRMRVPIKWHFNIRSPNGVIDLDVVASSRTFYSFLTQSGATIHYAMHSHSEGGLSLSDGRSIPLKDMRSYVETGWTALPLPAKSA